jgi:hypothetical protein
VRPVSTGSRPWLRAKPAFADSSGGEAASDRREVDDDVDPASTDQVADALIKADKDFDLVTVPSAGHGYGGAYGMRRLQGFFVRHLLGVEPRSRE